MNTLDLTSEECIILERRGFFVKKGDYTFGYFIKNSALGFGLTIFLIFFLFILGRSGIIGTGKAFFYLISLICFSSFILLLRSSIAYAYSSKYFYTEEGVIGFGKLFTDGVILRQKVDKIFFFIWGMRKICQIIHIPLSTIAAILIPIVPVSFLFMAGFAEDLPFGSMGDSLTVVFYYAGSVVLPGPTFFLGKIIINHLNSLYAFGNIGEKIQTLTPIIDEKSRNIQANFERDMNFGVLSDGFDTLSSTFSDIIKQVIRLERIEKYVSEGNLFKSEKYIHSLKADILLPLQSLQAFLQVQKEALIHSQLDLQGVHMGNNDLVSHVQLSSKRGSSLLGELQENIEKIDGMIEKVNS